MLVGTAFSNPLATLLEKQLSNLPARWAGRSRFVVLENGFGAGLNFLATWAAWQSDPNRPARLHYLATVPLPLNAASLQQALLPALAPTLAAWPEYTSLATKLCAQWPVLTPGFHRLEFVEENRVGVNRVGVNGVDTNPAAKTVVLTLMFGNALANLKQLNAEVDAFYLDGFSQQNHAPHNAPDMWSPALFKRLRQLAAPEATRVSHGVDPALRKALQMANFICKSGEELADQSACTRTSPFNHLKTPPTRAIILGAGLAGCAMAERLARRGWKIDLIERHAVPAQEGSGNLAGIVRPVLSRDDNFISRLSRAGFLHLRRAWASLELQDQHLAYELSGVFHIAQNAEHEAQQRQIIETRPDKSTPYPADFVQFLDRASASHLFGRQDAEPFFNHGGWWFPQGGWASPPALCQAFLNAAGKQLNTHFGQQATKLVWDASATPPCWHVLNAAGKRLASAPVIILASGTQAAQLQQSHQLPLTAMRGQVSHLPVGTLPPLSHAICGEGYLTPAYQGFHCLGASYSSSLDNNLQASDHAENLHRLQHILPDITLDSHPHNLPGRVSFRATTPDRLPLVGALPDLESAWRAEEQLQTLPRYPGLYGLLGLGSRGLVWASLAAEILASQICGEPHPVERDLVNAVDPARFALRAHRSHRTP